MSKVTLTKKLCKKWIAALRSGKFEQARGRLKHGNQNGTRYCCLGVAEEVCGLPRGDMCSLETDRIIGLELTECHILMRMNDDDRRPFPEIADHIEEKILPGCPDTI